MKNILSCITRGIAAMTFVAFGGLAQAATVSAESDNPLNFSWSFASGTDLFTGSGSMTLSGFNSSALTIAVWLSNTSDPSLKPLTSFGFGINPNATMVTFIDNVDGGMVGAELDDIPGLAMIEVCAFGGSNCAGGSNGGIVGGTSDSFSIVLAGNWGDSVEIDPIGLRYKTGAGTFEVNPVSARISAPTAVPEPGTGALALAGLGLIGLGLGRRRKAGRV